MYSFYYEIRVLRAHDGAEPPESWMSHPASSSPRHFSPEAPSARARTLYVSERSPVLKESGMFADSNFLGAGGTAGPGNEILGGPIPFWVLTNAECCHLPADLAPPPLCAYKAVFFFFLRLVMLLVRTLDRHWFMFLSSYKCSDLQAGNIADCT